MHAYIHCIHIHISIHTHTHKYIQIYKELQFQRLNVKSSSQITIIRRIQLQQQHQMSLYFKKYIKAQNQPYINKPTFKTNFTNCILQAFQHRNYEQTSQDHWHIIWSEKEFIEGLYEKKIAPHQKINHFKHYAELCKKDLLIRNLKKYKKALERDGKVNQANAFHFYPQTYVLPNQYVLFAEEFKKMQGHTENKNIWIMKPTGKSQGKGIFLFNKLFQIGQWESNSAEPYIVQKYINEPLLIGGKKFDIRIYVLVTSYSPLTVYLYRNGFARFTHCRYEESKIQQSEMHLTNVAIQKNAEGYDQNIGGKWYLHKLKKYLLSKFNQDAIHSSFYKIQEIVIKTLEAMQKVIATDKNNSFQLYGFDVLLDAKLQPWLIEVNGSPSMTANTKTDKQFKLGLLDDTLTVIDMENFLMGNQEQIGGYDLIYKNKATIKTNEKGINTLPQRVSFLGSENNRIENLKKMGKNYAVRLNTMYENKREESKRIMSSNSSHVNTAHLSKKNMHGRKLYTNQGYLLNAKLNQSSSQEKQNNQRGKLVISNKDHNTSIGQNGHGLPPKPQGRQFIIKQKVKRESTNENHIKC